MLPDNVDQRVLGDQLLQQEIDRMVSAGELERSERPAEGWTIKSFRELPVRARMHVE